MTPSAKTRGGRAEAYLYFGCVIRDQHLAEVPGRPMLRAPAVQLLGSALAMYGAGSQFASSCSSEPCFQLRASVPCVQLMGFVLQLDYEANAGKELE